MSCPRTCPSSAQRTPSSRGGPGDFPPPAPPQSLMLPSSDPDASATPPARARPRARPALGNARHVTPAVCPPSARPSVQTCERFAGSAVRSGGGC